VRFCDSCTVEIPPGSKGQQCKRCLFDLCDKCTVSEKDFSLGFDDSSEVEADIEVAEVDHSPAKPPPVPIAPIAEMDHSPAKPPPLPIAPIAEVDHSPAKPPPLPFALIQADLACVTKRNRMKLQRVPVLPSATPLPYTPIAPVATTFCVVQKSPDFDSWALWWI
jgi:hypothetical protein